MAYMTKSEFNLRPSVAAGLTSTGDVIITERGVPTYRLSRIRRTDDPWQQLLESGQITAAQTPRGVPPLVASGSDAILGDLLDDDRADQW